MPGDSRLGTASAARGLRPRFFRFFSTLARYLAAACERLPGKGESRRHAIRGAAFLERRNRRWLGVAGAAFILAGGIALSLLVRAPAGTPLENAIWLDRDWAYGELDGSRLGEFADRLRENRIGTAYVYVSTLGMDNQWSGGMDGERGFADTRASLAEFLAALKRENSQLRRFAWLEIWTNLDNEDGYRLDDSALHDAVADFSQLLASQLGFDGILLDVKPLFSDNNDLFRLIRRARSAVGAEVSIALAAAADLTPPDPRLRRLGSIAPGTMWSESFKKRVLISADEVVLPLYQSYRRDKLDYISWVAHHIEAYIGASESETKILASVPNYGGASPAHDPAIETMANALAGVREGLARLDAERRALLGGIALYSEAAPSAADWNTFREMWLQR